MRMATAILGSEGSETLEGDPYRFDKPNSPTGSGGGSSSDCEHFENRKSIERYIKFFTLKSVQVVVQSRLGKKVKTESNPKSSGNDWFNLNIEDNQEVAEQTKDALKSQSNEIPIVIEISLQSTTDPNTKLVLELWSILFDRSSDYSPNNAPRVKNNVYNKLTLLIKSLICVTRSLPAYRLSRKLNMSDEEEFKLYYNVFSAISLFKGERIGLFKGKVLPQGASSPPKDTRETGILHEYIDYGNVLGEGYKFNQLGKVPTTFGTLTLELAYRTKMELSSNFSQDCPYFNTGASAASNINKLMIKSDHYAIENPPLESTVLKGIGRQRNRSTPVTFGLMGRENMRPLVPGSPKYGGSPSSSPVTTSKKNLAAAFVDDPTLFSPIDEEADFDDMPLGTLLKKSMLSQKAQQQQHGNEKTNAANAQVAASQRNSKTLTNEGTVTLVTEQDESSNDFVLVDLKALPFAGGVNTSSGNADSSDPIQFFQEVQQAPMSLESLPPPPTGDDSGTLITDADLKSFESEMVIFDDFVKKLISTDQSPGE